MLIDFWQFWETIMRGRIPSKLANLIKLRNLVSVVYLCHRVCNVDYAVGYRYHMDLLIFLDWLWFFIRTWREICLLWVVDMHQNWKFNGISTESHWFTIWLVMIKCSTKLDYAMDIKLPNGLLLLFGDRKINFLVPFHLKV